MKRHLLPGEINSALTFKIVIVFFFFFFFLLHLVPLVRDVDEVPREDHVAEVDGEGPAPDREPPDLVDRDAGGQRQHDVVLGAVAVVRAEDGGLAVVVGEEAAVERVGEDDAVLGGGGAS